MRDRRQIDRLPLDVRPRDARHLQQSGHQVLHLLHRVADPLQILLRVFVELVAAEVVQRLAEAVDAGQRRAEVVRHRVRERLQLRVRCFQLGGAAAQHQVALLHLLEQLVDGARERSHLPFPLRGAKREVALLRGAAHDGGQLGELLPAASPSQRQRHGQQERRGGEQHAVRDQQRGQSRARVADVFFHAERAAAEGAAGHDRIGNRRHDALDEPPPSRRRPAPDQARPVRGVHCGHRNCRMLQET